MPVFRAGKDQAPRWCELEEFEFIAIKPGESRQFTKRTAKEELIVCRGNVAVTCGGLEIALTEGGKIDLNMSGKAEYSISGQHGEPLICRLMGRWKSITSSGIFSVQTAEPPKHDTPYSYKKTTRFDNHYHDCDEYWLVFEGEAAVASEGKLYDVKPGDCVATGMGWHHDVVSLKGGNPLRAVWFEGTLEGGKRTGHLWEPQHGKAMQMIDRQ